MKKTTVSTYKEDTYYPKVVRAVAAVLKRSDIVAPVDVLMEMGNLQRKNYDAWKKGQVPYLERVIEGNLSKVNRILRLIGFHANDLNMVPSHTAYMKSGKGKRIHLRFSKTHDEKIEAAWSRHFRWNQSEEKKQAVIDRWIEKT